MEQAWLPGKLRERITDLSKDKKVSQVKLAEATGISRSKLSRFLSGKSDSISHDDIIAIAHYFKVSTDFLLGETDAPDRKNYDIEELGLTVQAARNLYIGRANPEIVSQMLEHPSFGDLTSKIKIYKDGIISSEIATQNQVYASLAELITQHAKSVPEDKTASMDVLQTVKALSQPLFRSEIDSIQTSFMQIIQDIKKTGPQPHVQAKAITKKAMQNMTDTLTKSQNILDLQQITPDAVVDGIFNQLAAIPVPEALKPETDTVLQRLRDDLYDYFSILNKAKPEPPHDK